MCRRNHLLGCCCGCLGLGILLGHGFESGLLTLCLGLALIFGCFACLRQR